MTAIRKHSLLQGAGAVLATLALATPSYAADAKVLPGSTCSAFVDAVAQFYSTSNGVIEAFGDPILLGLVTCPILRDNTSNTTGLEDLDVVGHSVDGLECTAQSITSSGSILRSVFRTSADVGTVRLDFGSALGGSGASQFSSGASLSGSSYSLDCAVQQGESLRSYRWDE